MKEEFDLSRRPNIVPWPPIILGLCLIASILFSEIAPFQIKSARLSTLLEYPGLLCITSGIMLDIWALMEMFWSGTNIQPHQGADKLVTSGPFSYSRNPIYLGNTIALIGIGVGFNHLWFALMGVVHAIAVYVLAIRREEKHLAFRFGGDWKKYQKRVPRWIGPL